MERQHEYPFFANTACEHFPCHEGADPDDFNCLFCYCPLYALGQECGGAFYYSDDGVKCCDRCLAPHCGDAGTQRVRELFPKISQLAGRGCGVCL